MSFLPTGWSEAEIGDLWDSLYLQVNEIPDLLKHVKAQESQPFLEVQTDDVLLATLFFQSLRHSFQAQSLKFFHGLCVEHKFRSNTDRPENLPFLDEHLCPQE